MIGFNKVNLEDLRLGLGEEKLEQVLSSFSCPYNTDVDDFLHYKAKEFSRQRIASVYLVFASFRKSPVLVGYFALANKHFHIDLRKHGNVSSNLRRRIAKFANYDVALRKHVITAPLIGQLGKNYTNDYDKLITGDELLQIACDTVCEAQRIVGGKLVYLECDDVPSVVNFYERNGFYNFGKRALDADEKDAFSGTHLIQFLKYLR